MIFDEFFQESTHTSYFSCLTFTIFPISGDIDGLFTFFPPVFLSLLLMMTVLVHLPISIFLGTLSVPVFFFIPFVRVPELKKINLGPAPINCPGFESGAWVFFFLPIKEWAPFFPLFNVVFSFFFDILVFVFFRLDCQQVVRLSPFFYLSFALLLSYFYPNRVPCRLDFLFLAFVFSVAR